MATLRHPPKEHRILHLGLPTVAQNRSCQDETCLVAGDQRLVPQDRQEMVLVVERDKEAIDRREDQLHDQANKNAEAEVIARLRLESCLSSSTGVRMEHYENLFENERMPVDGTTSMERINTLETQVQEASAEISVLRAWNRRLDEALNQETNAANAGSSSKKDPRSGGPPPPSQHVGDYLKDDDYRRAADLRTRGLDVPNGEGPPGPPSLRGSQRESAADDLTSVTAASGVEPREYPGSLSLPFHQSDCTMFDRRLQPHFAVQLWCAAMLATMLSDKKSTSAAMPRMLLITLTPWIASLLAFIFFLPLELLRWMLPGLAFLFEGQQILEEAEKDASDDIDGLNDDSDPDLPGHVAMKLRLRTQASSRRGTFVMGRKILAMILNHFRTPGQRETTFTMEHIVRVQYLGDATSTTKKVDEPCWHWAKGKCRYCDKCNRRHDPHLFNTAPNTDSAPSNAAPALLHDDDSDFDTPVFKVATNKVKKKVKFDTKPADICTYVKKDFVKRTRKSQTEPKMHGKTGKSTDEIRKGEHWAYSCRLAVSRGKAMAIIMDEKGDYRYIDEVLIIVGPTLDIKIKMETEDDGEPVREIFVENYVPHVVGRYGKRGNIMCITVPVEERDKNFIMDSGSKTPYMIDADGNVIEMIIKDYIPYVSENVMVIDGESGDELEDLSDNVRRSEGKSPKKRRKSKKIKIDEMPKVAVGSDEMSCHAGDYDEFDDDAGDFYEYEPSIGPDVDDVDHDIEIEEIPEADKREDDDDVIDVDEEDGSV
eukprot:s3183_g9.t1